MILFTATNLAHAEVGSVYSVRQGISLGDPGETEQRDLVISIGSEKGLKVGSVLEVYRKTPTFDDQSQKFVKDLKVPFAKIKVIHVENEAAVARLDALLPRATTAAVIPAAVMVGDEVKVVKSP